MQTPFFIFLSLQIGKILVESVPGEHRKKLHELIQLGDPLASIIFEDHLAWTVPNIERSLLYRLSKSQGRDKGVGHQLNQFAMVYIPKCLHIYSPAKLWSQLLIGF